MSNLYYYQYYYNNASITIPLFNFPCLYSILARVRGRYGQRGATRGFAVKK